MKYVLFWFTSNKGSDYKFVFRTRLSKDEIKDRCEAWASSIINNGPYSESIVQYGFRQITMPPKTVLRQKYEAACKSKRRAQERWSILAAMLHPRDL